MSGLIKEKDLILPTLRLLDESPSGTLTTSELIPKLEEIFQPRGKDADILPDRSDTHFSQKVRNLVSHRKNNDFGKKGYAKYFGEKIGWKITQEGQKFVKNQSE